MVETVDTSIDAFEAYMAKVRAKGTADKYAMGARFFLTALGNMGFSTIEELPPNTLTNYAAKLAGDGYAAQTVHLYNSAAKRYLRWLREQGIRVPQQHDPDLPRVHQRVRDILPPEFLPRYMELAGALLSEPARTAVKLMPCLGLRGSEIVSLKLGDMSRKRVTLRDGTVKDAIVFKVVGKGGDEKLVPLLDEGKDILFEYLGGWRRYKKGVWLFPKTPQCKRHIMDRSLRDALSKLCDPLGMNFSPHTMRRTYLVTLWRRGVDATVIAKIAGHRSIQTTFKSYLALDEQDILKSMFGETRGS